MCILSMFKYTLSYNMTCSVSRHVIDILIHMKCQDTYVVLQCGAFKHSV